jgi:hypothetical protein
MRTPCQDVTVFTFRGNRTRAFSSSFLRSLRDQKVNAGPGPSSESCLVHTGHAGIRLAGATTIFGFNPDIGAARACDVFESLKQGRAWPGIVRDDTAIFAVAASKYGLTIQTIRLRLSDSAYIDFKTKLDNEVLKTNYKYGFPDGDGDCNCITWMERLGLPLLTGRMDEFANLPGFAVSPARRFGECT